MIERSALAWLRDARDYALEAQAVVSAHTLETFDANRRDQLAVRYCLTVIGEALNQIPRDVQALAPEIRWRTIYNLRNRLVHGFLLIDAPLLLGIARKDCEQLVASIDRLIEKLGS